MRKHDDTSDTSRFLTILSILTAIPGDGMSTVMQNPEQRN